MQRLQHKKVLFLFHTQVIRVGTEWRSGLTLLQLCKNLALSSSEGLVFHCIFWMQPSGSQKMEYIFPSNYSRQNSFIWPLVTTQKPGQCRLAVYQGGKGFHRAKTFSQRLKICSLNQICGSSFFSYLITHIFLIL